MYKEYGTAMFAMLDAEFACIIYDGEREEYIAARDPIGIRPLYYGYDKQEAIIFASEPKNLVGIVENIMPFPPVTIIRMGNLYVTWIFQQLQKFVKMIWKKYVEIFVKS